MSVIRALDQHRTLVLILAALLIFVVGQAVAQTTTDRVGNGIVVAVTMWQATGRRRENNGHTG